MGVSLPLIQATRAACAEAATISSDWQSQCRWRCRRIRRQDTTPSSRFDTTRNPPSSRVTAPMPLHRPTAPCSRAPICAHSHRANTAFLNVQAGSALGYARGTRDTSMRVPCACAVANTSCRRSAVCLLQAPVLVAAVVGRLYALFHAVYIVCLMWHVCTCWVAQLFSTECSIYQRWQAEALLYSVSILCPAPTQIRWCMVHGAPLCSSTI
jgi:hypothetical protein